MTCNITGLKAHWSVEWEGTNPHVMYFNGVRSLVAYLRTQGVEITTFNLYDIERSRNADREVGESRLERFIDHDITSVKNMRTGTDLMTPNPTQD